MDQDEGDVDDRLRDGVGGGAVEGEGLVLQEDGSGLEGCRQLGEGKERVEEEHEEDDTAAGEDACCGFGQVVEERADDERLEEDTAPFPGQ